MSCSRESPTRRLRSRAAAPRLDIPVIGPGDLVDAAPDSVLLFVPDLLDEVRKAMPGIEAAGGRWVGRRGPQVRAPAQLSRAAP